MLECFHYFILETHLFIYNLLYATLNVIEILCYLLTKYYYVLHNFVLDSFVYFGVYVYLYVVSTNILLFMVISPKYVLEIFKTSLNDFETFESLKSCAFLEFFELIE